MYRSEFIESDWMGAYTFYSRRVVGDFTSRQFVGKLYCNFRPTWSEVIRRNTNWQAGHSGTTLLILQISLWNNLRKIACRANIPVTLRTISAILAARVFNRYRKRTSSQIETKFRYDLSRNPMLITYNLIDKSL